MVRPIVITALVGAFGAQVAKVVAKKLDQVFLNLETAVENHLSTIVLHKYSLQDLQNIQMKQICFAIQKKCVMFVPFDAFVHNQDLFLGQKVFYVFVPKSAAAKFDVVGQIAFDDRDKFLTKITEKIIPTKLDVEIIAQQIIKKVRTNQ